MTPKTLVSMIRSMGNMTQKQVATACGLPQSMISKIERDKVVDIMSKSYLALFRLYHEVLSKQGTTNLMLATHKTQK